MAKKPEIKKTEQEPHAEQKQPPEGGADTVAPMAAAAPSLGDRIAALELANIELEKRLKKHEEYHFGRPGE